MFQFHHLAQYPHLLQFCQKEQIPIVHYAQSDDKLTIKNIVAFGEPDKCKNTFKSRRTEIEASLNFAYRYNILNKEKISRLKSDSPTNYWSTLSELMIGVWLENQGLNIRCVEPHAFNGKKGDYLVERNGKIVFIEIKTLLGEKDALAQEEILRDIVRLCREKQLPVETIQCVQYPNCYDYKNEKETLLEDIERSIVSESPASSTHIINFKNKSGIWIRIWIAPNTFSPSSFGWARVSLIQDYLSERLNKDDIQVSKENIPSICVINDFNSNVDKNEIEIFLYGRTCSIYTKPEKPFFRQNEGIWSGDSKSELSAMLILRFESNSVKIKTSDAYLCPNPKYALSISIFSDKKINWWKLDSDGISIVSSQE
jgi:hypothetical protein